MDILHVIINKILLVFLFAKHFAVFLMDWLGNL